MQGDVMKYKIRLLHVLFFSLHLPLHVRNMDPHCRATSNGNEMLNEKVRSTIKHHIGPHEDLATVKNRKLKWFGHVTRSYGLMKTILQGTVEGNRKTGRQKKWWTDNAEEWTGKPLAETQALAHDRNRWRRLLHGLSRWRPNGGPMS